MVGEDGGLETSLEVIAREAGGLFYGGGSKTEMNGVKAISEVEMVELGDELNEVNEILIC